MSTVIFPGEVRAGRATLWGGGRGKEGAERGRGGAPAC